METQLLHICDRHWNDLGNPHALWAAAKVEVSTCQRAKETFPSGLSCEKCMAEKLSEHMKSVLETSTELWRKFGLEWLDITKELRKNYDELNVVLTSSLTLFLRMCTDLFELPWLWYQKGIQRKTEHNYSVCSEVSSTALPRPSDRSQRTQPATLP